MNLRKNFCIQIPEWQQGLQLQTDLSFVIQASPSPLGTTASGCWLCKSAEGCGRALSDSEELCLRRGVLRRAPPGCSTAVPFIFAEAGAEAQLQVSTSILDFLHKQEEGMLVSQGAASPVPKALRCPLVRLECC